jgi:hypothetical protein
VTKDEAIRHLHRLAHAAVTGQVKWPSDRNLNMKISSMLFGSGLARYVENSPDGHFTVKPEIDLLLYCIRFYEPTEAPYHLETDGFISEEEADAVWETTTEADALAMIKLLLTRAYAERFGQSSAHH